MLPLKEEDIYKGYKNAIVRICGDLSDIIGIVTKSIEEEFKIDSWEDFGTVSDKLSKHRKIVMDTFKKRNKGEISTEEYQKIYEDESRIITELEAEETRLKNANTEKLLRIDKLDQMKKVIENHDVNSKESIRQLLDSIVVLDKTHIKYVFKCGQEVTQEI